MSAGTSVVILAAGQGKRMKSARPKVLHPLCGRPMLAWVIDQAVSLSPERILLVVGHGADLVESALAHHGHRSEIAFVQQPKQLGTGDALKCCMPALKSIRGGENRVVVLYGDMPLLSRASLERLLETQAHSAAEGATILTSCPDDPSGFGRIVRDSRGVNVKRIVEERDASIEERAIPEVNLGVYAFHGPALLEALPRLTNENRQSEYYLTDVVGMFVAAGRPVQAVELEAPEEGIGVNSLSDLSLARTVLQTRILEQHLADGVYIEDPATTYIDHGVEIGAGTKILPCTVIRGGVKIGKGCEVGPFTQLRSGTVLEDGAEIGNFTECKNTHVGRHAKAKHLAYLGDADIGAETNIGAGTIFANYDGRHKHPSRVGEKAFIGSGTVIVAPNSIADGATTGAGAVITRNANVGIGEVWVGVPARPLAKSGASNPSGAKKPKAQ